MEHLKQKDKTTLKRLQKLLNKKQKDKDNLLKSRKKCNIDLVKDSFFEEIQKTEQERIAIEKQIKLEHPVINEK